MSTTETVPPQLGQAVALAQRALIPAGMPCSTKLVPDSTPTRR